MSRLYDAIDAVRKAAGDRAWCLVIDECDPTTLKSRIVVHSSGEQPGYVLDGLMREGLRVAQSSDEPEDDEPEIPDTPE